MNNSGKKNESDYKTFRAFHWLLLFVLLMSATMLVEWNANDFHASVIQQKTADPFDGTTTPVLKVPKWTALTTAERSMTYDQLPADKLIPFPVYNPDDLKTPTEQLGWKTDHDLAIRNEKITFPVAYMGNYKLDGVEYAGSHLAVDIKVPTGTPVYAIANGVVVKAVEQTTGFGQHIVIKHENASSLNNASTKETLYSSYSHLSQVIVAEGDVVKKGQFIAKSGDTGTATTPHIHFQIDNSNAPWHPYWPFTYQEASVAGLDFTSAINEGLGKDKALQTTINPMLYVQKYLSGTSATPSVTPSTTTSTPTSTPSSTPTSTGVSDLPPVTITEPPTTTPDASPITPVVTTVPDTTPTETFVSADSFKIEHPDSFHKGVPIDLVIKAVDSGGNTIAAYNPQNNVNVSTFLGGAEVPPPLTASSFVNGEARVQVTPTSSSPLMIEVTDGLATGKTDAMTTDVFTDVDQESTAYKAVKFLKEHTVIEGYPDGTFKPDAVVSRVEALKFILKGVNSNLISTRVLPFKDTVATEWYSDYVATGYNKQIIDGYPDQTFKPANTVNRAEFLKMLLSAMDADVKKVVTRDVYSDVPKDAWYAPYVQFAKDKNLVVVSGAKFRPQDGMTRAEVAETMYRMIILKLTGAQKYSTGVTVSENTAEQYFS